MSVLFWLAKAQIARVKPFFPMSYSRPQVDGRNVLRGIIFFNSNSLGWTHAPTGCCPSNTLYNLWKRWGDAGIFARIPLELTNWGSKKETLMIDAIHIKTHRNASSLDLKKGGRRRLIRRTKDGMNSDMQTITDAFGRHLHSFLTAGQRSH